MEALARRRPLFGDQLRPLLSELNERLCGMSEPSELSLPPGWAARHNLRFDRF